MATPLIINIDDLAQVDALFLAVQERWGPGQLESYLRQIRSPEDIRRDNADAQADYEREAARQGCTVQELLR